MKIIKDNFKENLDRFIDNVVHCNSCSSIFQIEKDDV